MARWTARHIPTGTRACLVAVLTAGALSSCTSSPHSNELPAPAQSPAPASASADPTAKEREAVLAAYSGMWGETIKAFATASLTGVDLQKYTRDKAMTNIMTTVIYYQDHNQVVPGKPALSPKVTALDLDSTPHRATIQDCVDSTNWTPVDKTTGKPAQLSDSNRRHPNTYTAMLVSGHWLISDSSIDRDHSC